MTRKVRTIGPSKSVVHARELIRKHRINQLPVVSNDKLLGIVTDRDLRDAAILDDSVQTIMTRPVITLSAHSTLVNVAEVMRAQRIGSVPIVSGDSVIGIVTRSDILEAFVAYTNGSIQIIQAGHD